MFHINRKVAVSFSWGWLLIGEIAQGTKPWDAKRLLGAVGELRDLVREKKATAGELVADAADVRREKLNSIAVSLDVPILPPSFDTWAHRISLAIGGSLDVIGHLHHIPFVGLAWPSSTFRFERMRGEIAGHSRIPYSLCPVFGVDVLADQLDLGAIE